MKEKEKIKQLLIEVNNDITKIKELEKYNSQKVVDVIFEEKLYDSLLIIFKPITIDGITKIYFDAFSTDLLQRIKNTCDTKEQAEQKAKEEYEKISALPEEEKKFYYASTYEEMLSSKIIISKEFKEKLREALFSIDMELIRKIKIKDSHARQISGWQHPINTVEDVILYSELPCLAPSIELFNKNIITTMNDTEGVIGDETKSNGICKIWFNYKLLSQENKDIVEELISSGCAEKFMDNNVETISIFVPCSQEETVGEVSDKLEAIVSKLKMQDLLYASQTLESFYEEELGRLMKIHRELSKKYFDKDECTWDDVIMFAKENGYFYDPEEDLLWCNKNYYERHKKYISSLPPQSSTL